MKALFSSISILFLLLISGCGVTENNESVNHFIVFGESIDGVRIGDSEFIVKLKIGTPDEITTWSTSKYKYHYKNGIHAGMYFIFEQGKGVQTAWVDSAYNGRTLEGVGIGSIRSKVNDTYPIFAACYTNEDGSGGDAYIHNNVTVIFSYKGNKVDVISVYANSMDIDSVRDLNSLANKFIR